jgi:hypothetical protein
MIQIQYRKQFLLPALKRPRAQTSMRSNGGALKLPGISLDSLLL